MQPGNAVNFILVPYTPPLGSGVNFELGTSDFVPFFVGFMPYGKLGEEGEPDPLRVKGIWHRRMVRGQKVSIRMKFYRPTNPETEPQQANRAKFAAAMSAWGALTENQKSGYIKRAKKRGMNGWGLFIREYYQNN